MVEKVSPDDGLRRELKDHVAEVCVLFRERHSVREVEAPDLLRESMAAGADAGYVAAVQGLPPEAAGAAVVWLQGIVDDMCARAGALLPSLGDLVPS